MELSISEASKYLGISERTLYRKAKQGLYSIKKVGKKTFIIIDDVKEKVDNPEPTSDNQVSKNDILINELIQQLKVKDEQINTFQKLLENQQVLTKDLQSRVLYLEDTRTRKSVEPDLKTKEKVKGKPQAKKKQGFFQRLFRKRR